MMSHAVEPLSPELAQLSLPSLPFNTMCYGGLNACPYRHYTHRCRVPLQEGAATTAYLSRTNCASQRVRRIPLMVLPVPKK